MKVGISSAVYYPLETEIAIDKVLKQGFKDLEFFFNCEYEISKEYAVEIKKRLDCENARLVSVHPYTAFAEGVLFFTEYRRRTEETIKKYEKHFKISSFLGAKYFTFHGNRAMRGLSDESYVLSDEQCKTLNRLADIALDNGVTLCLENVSWCKSANINYLLDVSRRVPNIGFTLDLKQAHRAGIAVDEYLEVMGRKLKNIHISDYDAENDCLLPGEGVFEFSGFFKKLKQIGYSGDVIIEVYSSDFTEDCRLSASKAWVESKITNV